jgi:uncharacterized RDD family membrane protein YckC
MGILRKRITAFVVDRLVILTIGTFPVWYIELLVTTQEKIHTNPFFPPFFLPFFISFSSIYILIFEGLASGQTLGKRMVGIMVVDGEGRPIGVKKSILRNILRLIDAFPLIFYILGISLIKIRGKRLGDVLAGTEVVEGRTKWKLKNFIPFLLLILPCILPLTLSESSDKEDVPFLTGVVVSKWPDSPEERRKVLDGIKSAGFNTIRFHDFERLPSPDLIMEIEKRDFSIILGTGETWMVRKSREDALRLIESFGDFDIIYFAIGNEDYSSDLTIPRGHLEEIHQVFKNSGKKTIFANHMIMHSPDLLLLFYRGYGPIGFTDAIGFNAYPLAQAASWYELVEMWWNDTRVNPLYQFFIDSWMHVYFSMKPLLEKTKKITYGYGYLVNSYVSYAKLKNRPIIITEFGADDDPETIKSQLEILKKFELDGIIFYSWNKIDKNLDGKIDDHTIHEYFSQKDFA